MEARIEGFEEELRREPAKREAVALQAQLLVLTQRCATMAAEMAEEKKRSPEELRDQLLAQVKADNQEIAGMERRLAEIAAEITSVQEQMEALDEEPQPDDEDKRAKYLELLKREGEMQAFLGAGRGGSRGEGGGGDGPCPACWCSPPRAPARGVSPRRRV